jgi:hypothetical protein
MFVTQKIKKSIVSKTFNPAKCQSLKHKQSHKAWMLYIIMNTIKQQIHFYVFKTKSLKNIPVRMQFLLFSNTAKLGLAL